MGSKIDIFNLALTNISAKAFVESLTENSVERKYCSANYEAVVKSVLADHDWNCASKQATLAETAGTAYGMWAYQYALPGNCVAVREIVRSSDNEKEIPFKVDLDEAGTGLVIHTDRAAAKARYTYALLTPSLYSAKLTEAVGWKLATRIWRPLTGGNKQIQQFVEEGYQRALAEARREDANEEVKRDDPDPETIQARN